MSRLASEMPKWDMRDQFTLMFAWCNLVELADSIMRKYDGRNKRMNEFIDALRGDEK